MRLKISGLVCAVGLTMPTPASAQGPAEGESEASGAINLSTDAGAEGDVESETSVQPRKWNPRKDQPWIRRWAPEPHMIELGLYGGLFKLNEQHELFEPDVSIVPLQGWEPMRKLNPDI